ncbi:hypothetical protein [Amycolatopsis sp. H20-H5]|uniref:hypothetical protein n=1 Tax=Amycolatopsis sp. H20-H5 TaxID=3046309 RepID=UPI002DB8F1D3|nr:hypothetical protein [Amycolatopsis sp. H20-H5]MEC3976138.1 hypothetical protein [Amycolatopsis sp. H20-H5]
MPVTGSHGPRRAQRLKAVRAGIDEEGVVTVLVTAGLSLCGLLVVILLLFVLARQLRRLARARRDNRLRDAVLAVSVESIRARCHVPEPPPFEEVRRR